MIRINDSVVAAFEDEWSRWAVRNIKKQSGIEYEVIRTGGSGELVSDDTIKVAASFRGRDNAKDKMEKFRIQYSISAALKAVGVECSLRPDEF